MTTDPATTDHVAHSEAEKAFGVEIAKAKLAVIRAEEAIVLNQERLAAGRALLITLGTLGRAAGIPERTIRGL